MPSFFFGGVGYFQGFGVLLGVFGLVWGFFYLQAGYEDSVSLLGKVMFYLKLPASSMNFT